MRFGKALVLCMLLLSVPFVSAGAAPEDAIRNVLEQQVVAWNRGDLKEFVSFYAPHCTLVGSTISEATRAQVLAHYQARYPSSGARGKLTFSGLTVHQIDARVAAVTGHWHLHREAASGGSVGGVFSLVLELVDGRWQIALDHTS